MSTRATPATRCRRLPTLFSPRIDISRALRVFDTSTTLTTGSLLSLFQRTSVGGLTSRGKPDCVAASRSRSSCIARSMLVSRLNSMLITPWPSWAREVMRLTPATLLKASSIGLMTSRSTASGEAPG
jgi:hypothetical protein